MRFKDVQCEYCHNKFTDSDDVVVCPICGSPHHRACYNENGRCVNQGKHKDGFSWEFPEELKPKPPESRPNRLFELDIKFKNGEAAVRCPHCGTPNYQNDALCLKCRKPLTGEAEKDRTAFSSEEERASYYHRFGGLRPDIMIEGLPAEEIADYIGTRRSGSYIRKFVGMERTGRKFFFSLAAFIFGPIWFFYRKLYKEGLIYFLIIALLSGISALCMNNTQVDAIISEMASGMSEVLEISVNTSLTPEERNKLTDEKLQELQAFMYSDIEYTEGKYDKIKLAILDFIRIAEYALPFVSGFFAEYLYKKKVFRDIKALRKSTPDKASYTRALKKKGGVSLPGAIFAAGIYSVLYFFPSYPYVTMTYQIISDFISNNM